MKAVVNQVVRFNYVKAKIYCSPLSANDVKKLKSILSNGVCSARSIKTCSDIVES